MIKRIDEDLLDLFEKVSSKVQLLIGVNCLKQGFVAYLLATLIMMSMTMQIYLLVNWLTFFDLTFIMALLLLSLGSAYYMYLITERRTSDQNQQAYRNENYLGWFPGRMLSCLLFLVFFGIAVFYRIDMTKKFCILGIGSFILSFEYLLSCTPLPPGKSKAREFLESVFAKEATNEKAK